MRKMGILAVVFAILSAVTGFASGPLSVYFIDVGQGDAILIDCGGWEALLDAGPGTRAANAELLAVLSKHVEDGEIELAILSHPDADHYGGFAEVLRQYRVLEFWASGDEPDSFKKGFVAFKGDLAAEGAAEREMEQGDSDTIRGLRWVALGPTDSDTTEMSDNDESLVLLLSYRNVHFLFPGDIGETGAEALDDIALPVALMVIKVPHHGSDDGLALLDRDDLHPTIAVISVGNNHEYGHPSERVLAELGDEVQVYITTRGNTNGYIRDDSFISSEHPNVHENVGTIVVQTDGDCLWVIIDGLEQRLLGCNSEVAGF